MKKILAIIPARGGSKGIHRKNLKLLNGKPLVSYSIDSAKNSKCINRIIVSTDDEEISKVSIKFGAEVILRPKKLSGDKAASEQALLHALDYLAKQENYKPDYIIFMQCTTPLITGEDIDETYAELITNNADVSHIVTPFHGFVWKLNKDKAGVGINHDIRKRLRRQDLEKQYLETGALYVMNAEGFIRERNRFFGKITFHSIPLERSIEIDNMIDFKLAELHSNRKK